MSIAASLPIHQLTEDQAVEELAHILDSAPDESDQLAFIHWKQGNAGRAQQLQAHILHLHNLAEKAIQSPAGQPEGNRQDSAPVSLMEPQDAPPHHLRPEPPKASTTPKEKPVSARKTPKEKMQSLVDAYHTLVDKLQVDPTVKRIRDDASTCKTRMRMLEREFHISAPELRPIPPLPSRAVEKKPVAPAAEVPMEAIRAPEPSQADLYPHHADPLPPKAGPGPYKEPTANDLLDEMRRRGKEMDQAPPSNICQAIQRFVDDVLPVPGLVRTLPEAPSVGEPVNAAAAPASFPSPCAEDCVHPAHHHSTADLDQRDRHIRRSAAPEMFAAPSDALSSLRQIRRDTWLLLAQLADLAPEERERFRSGLEAVVAGMEEGLVLLDEDPAAEAI